MVRTLTSKSLSLINCDSFILHIPLKYSLSPENIKALSIYRTKKEVELWFSQVPLIPGGILGIPVIRLQGIFQPRSFSRRKLGSYLINSTVPE